MWIVTLRWFNRMTYDYGSAAVTSAERDYRDAIGDATLRFISANQSLTVTGATARKLTA